VCEKRAALDVVYHRIKQNKLAELCCYIHDSQGDKKEFIKDLRTVYEDFLKNKMDVAAIGIKRKAVLDQLLGEIKLLQTYHYQQRNIDPSAGVSTRELFEILNELKGHIQSFDDLQNESIPHYRLWLQYGDVIHQLSTSLEETGAGPQLADHPFSNLAGTVIKADNPLTLIDSLVNHSQSSIQQLTSIIAQNNIPSQHAAQLENIKNLIEDSVLLEPIAKSKNLKLVEVSNPESREFEQAYSAYKDLIKEYQQAIEGNKKWVNKFDKNEVGLAIDLAQKHERAFFSFLFGNWRRLKKQLKQSYDFASHQVLILAPY
jgi:TolA-binding protein